MTHGEVTRRLTTIVAADVAGYSRLMAEDDEATLAALRAHRGELIDPKIAEYRGRIANTAGDSLLIEFPSVVEALRCAMDVQATMATRNIDVPGKRRIEFRVGINIGDVMEQDGDLFGDGVNIAARLEALAEAGGICISGSVHEHLAGKSDAVFVDAGERTLKNIARPVRIWHWRTDHEARAAKGMDEAPSLPDKPSIAVLPFVNMSGDPAQEFFADGMTEDIITTLSRFRSLFVIARNSSFAYKGQSPDVREVSRDLGVRYILEGSVRRGGRRIRITAQLIDAETGNHIWAERSDRGLDDVFAVQDDVTEAIVGAIAPQIGDVERRRAERKPPESLDAWDFYQRGLADFHSSSAQGYRSAIEQFDRVNALDPSFAPAFAMAAFARTQYIAHFEADDREEMVAQAREKARRGTALDSQDSTCLWSDARVHAMLGHHDIALSKAEEAVALNPNDAMSRHSLGSVLCSAGKAGDALAQFDHAMRLSPRDIWLTGMLTYRAFVLFHLERYGDAFEEVRRASLRPNPRVMTFALLAAAAGVLGRGEEARGAVDDLLAHAPATTCAKFRGHPYFGSPEVMERFVEALRASGLPEE